MTDTTQMKTTEQTGKALDWAVAKAEGATNLRFDTVATWWFTDARGDDRALSSGWSRAQSWHPSTNWEQAGPIIEREYIVLEPVSGSEGTNMAWCASTRCGRAGITYFGPTPLIAAMRCYAASKIGDEGEIPAALLNGDRP